MNAIYVRRRRKVLLREGDGIQSDAVLAAFQKNLEGLGFVMKPRLMEQVKSLNDDKLDSFYKSLIKDLMLMVGAHRSFEPMYPNFPEQVKKTPESMLYLNAILHYFTNKLPAFPKEPRPAFAELTQLTPIDLGDKEDFEAMFTRLVGAKTSLAERDKEDVAWFVAQYGRDILRLLPKEIPSKENLAVLGAALLKYDAAWALDILSPRIKTATDVLRLAVARSGGDVSLAKAVKFGSFKRGERRALLSWLERTGHPVEDMLRWKPRWVRLGERLHPGDYCEEFPKTYAAFKSIRNNEKVATFNSQLEQFLAKPSPGDALELLGTRPGDLARRIDHLLRLSPDTASVLDSFRARAAKVSSPVLLQVHSHFRQRDAMPDLRIFFPKGDVAKVYAERNKLPALPAGVSPAVVAICEEKLMERFRELRPLGPCWVDDRLAKFMVPLAQRSASKSLRTLTRGSRVPLPEARVLRFFIWWKNGKSRVDIDLSAVLFDSSQKYVGVLSYYNLKDFGGCHSGDIVDAPKGAAEFIDVEPELLRKAGVRYIMMSINSYTQQPYCDLPECFAGWMARQQAGSGEVFEPRTVVDKVDVASDTRICIPAVFDLEANEVIWADLALTSHPRYQNNVHGNLAPGALMLRSLTTLAKPDLHKLFSLHAQARGTLVADKAAAQTVFSVDEGITPFEVDRIRAEFL